MPDWPAIVTEYGPLAWRVAYRLVAHDADAADCVQNTFAGALGLHASEGVRDWPGGRNSAACRLASQ